MLALVVAVDAEGSWMISDVCMKCRLHDTLGFMLDTIWIGIMI
jgi:hypothetical protein